MSTTPTPDPELRDLLRSWEVEPREDPALARQVWARIDAQRPAVTPGWLDWLSQWIARPTIAAAAIAVFAVGGGLAAHLQQANRHEARVTQLAAEYARSIDPILMTHPVDHAGHAP